MSNQVILRLNAMGDILLAIPVARQLGQQHKVFWVINKKWKDLRQFLPAEVMLYDGATSLLSLSKEIRSLSPEMVIDLQGKISSFFMKHFSGAKYASYRKRSLSEQWQISTGQYPINISNDSPVWKRYADTAGIEISAPDPLLEMTPDYLASSRELAISLGLKPKEYFLIHPDASKPGKILPEEGLREILRQAPQTTAIIGTGSRNFNLNDFPNLIDLRNKISLDQLPGIMANSSGVISTDSGPMHLARATDAPLVCLFFQTDPSLGFSPVPSTKNLVISKPLPCKPCSIHGQREDCPEGHFNCRALNWKKVSTEIWSFMDVTK